MYTRRQRHSWSALASPAPLPLVLCALLVFAAVSRAFAEPIMVRDFLNRQVSLAEPARRVVALAPHIVENVFSAGAGQALVGVVSFSNFPAEAQQLPVVGSYKAFSLETILSLRPDLIIMWASGNGLKALSKLESLGVPVYVDEPATLDDVARSIGDIGRLTGTEKTALRQAERFHSELAALRARYELQTPVELFYQIWHEPLQTINGAHIINDVIELCGGQNVFADALVLAPKVNIESVLQRDPQVIIASGMSKARPEWLDQWHRWPTLRAVRDGHLFFVPPDLLQRHTLRLLQGAQRLCGQLASVRND